MTDIAERKQHYTELLRKTSVDDATSGDSQHQTLRVLQSDAFPVTEVMQTGEHAGCFILTAVCPYSLSGGKAY